jgi:hypothetical protein
MTEDLRPTLSRRTVLAAGGAGALAVAAPLRAAAATSSIGLPVADMTKVLQADGTVSGGVLEVDIDRSDLTVVGPDDVRFEDGFQLQHEFYFQSLGGGTAMMNGDMSLRPSETQPVIERLEELGFTFQAFHQHLYDLSPMVWFIHMRIVGEPIEIARKAHELVKVTSTPLPQHSPAHPTTPLPAQRLAGILGGDATVGENGIVTVSVDRKDPITLGGHRVKPGLGVSSSVQFQPLGGQNAAVIPDFSMTAAEVDPVVKVMRGQGWQVGCLYNQEIGEQPQLYFSHMFRRGDAVALAHEVRRGLDRTAV